ncbi:MAG: hypothetical protein IPI21_11960 [Propionivibrio sp.]|nr:hypothetical protein [Propionivibrio sp.]
MHGNTIPAGTYQGVAAIQTLAVGAQWVTTKDRFDLIYQVAERYMVKPGKRHWPAAIRKEDSLPSATP